MQRIIINTDGMQLPVERDLKSSYGPDLKYLIQPAIDWLRNGGVVMHATETCYGLAVDIFNAEALVKLYELKRMDRGKAVSIMVDGMSQALEYAEFNDFALGLASKYWPGPLTLILQRGGKLPGFLNPNFETVGVRCPNSEVSRYLIRGMGGPLTTTSANLSGLPEVYNVDDYLAQVGEGVGAGDTIKEGVFPDIILDSGLLERNLPSTIVDCTSGKVLREGGVKVDL